LRTERTIVSVQRAQTAQVDHLDADPLFLLQATGDVERHDGHPRVGHHGNVRARFGDGGPADLHDTIVVLGNLPARVVEGQVLDEEDRIVVKDGRLQQGPSVGRRGGRDHLQARCMSVPDLDVLGMRR